MYNKIILRCMSYEERLKNRFEQLFGKPKERTIERMTEHETEDKGNMLTYYQMTDRETAETILKKEEELIDYETNDNTIIFTSTSFDFKFGICYHKISSYV